MTDRDPSTPSTAAEDYITLASLPPVERVDRLIALRYADASQREWLIAELSKPSPLVLTRAGLARLTKP